MHLKKYLESCGMLVYSCSRQNNQILCDITNKESVKKAIIETEPNFIINLAAISFVGHDNYSDFYSINTVGAINVLDAIVELKCDIEKIILASSAVVYGAQTETILHEGLTPHPVNHYGMSKYAMELLAESYFDKLNILITRPFNYTGVGHSENFVIPKIVSHFKQQKKTIELGNLDVYREYNDILYICELYYKLLLCNVSGEIINLCSQKALSLSEILSTMGDLAGYNIGVNVNPAFVRPNEIKYLIGSRAKLDSFEIESSVVDFKKMLRTMYES